METERSGFFSRVLRHAWINLVPLVRGNDTTSLSCKEAQLWGLILASRHVPYRLERLPDSEGGRYIVEVQEWFGERAFSEIKLYFEENQPDWRGARLTDLRPVSGLEPTVFGLVMLMLFFWAYTHTYPGLGLYPERWINLGSAAAGAILTGELWRLATALTLHANGPHVAGNCVIGGVFIWLVARRIGSGMAWMTTILAGVLGNLCNSMVLGVHHNAIGFSTATFGAAGVLASITPFVVGGGVHGLGQGDLVQRSLRFVRTALVPFAAGLGLLAMLGAGKETDLSAHLFGFVAGLGLGSLVGLQTTRAGVPGRILDGCLYAAALSIPVLAWIWAWVA
ncbi:rhomboid family intramembrane serine protease [Pseudodesulfovibrio sediminis]|uniref:Rhomboid family intramembrane serine protease n=1 Tax=Pseudodesulfovibrio sediminis TaxID=2810563 RepID=A0ABN6EUV9_9BACT|nr:rhomboid family intramembrane serine protease [Pseudodesulfovibrio sediminis]BCS90102.1 rhomboid family intramembrane serine protease [Pseudodesulfovibrio sediminis]